MTDRARKTHRRRGVPRSARPKRLGDEHRSTSKGWPPGCDQLRIETAASVGAAVRVGMVEGVKRMASVDLELEAVVGSRVGDADGDAARGLVPEQVDIDSAARAVRRARFVR